jgi:hypothetical protein
MWPAQFGVRPRLDLAGTPTSLERHGLQHTQQHRLTNPTQPGQHQRTLRTTTRDPLQHHLERLQLTITASQLRGPLAGPGGERLAYRVHKIGPYRRILPLP